MKLFGAKNLLLALALTSLAACGDSSGPGTVSDEAALRSLSIGLGSATGAGLPFALTPATLGTSARGIDRIDVAINGTTHTMYALGLRITYPAGTCIEAMFIVTSFPPPVGQCTPPPLGLVLVLWETSSGSRAPERMAFISADVGTSSFASFSEPGDDFSLVPNFAIYLTNDREEFWTSVGGSLTSQVAATNETCNVTPPPFASASTCHFATFDEAGQITFEKFDFALFEPGLPAARETMEFSIPRQSIRGILQAVTAIKPVTIPDWDY